jgi:mono/diheme cytochrome c family protein
MPPLRVIALASLTLFAACKRPSPASDDAGVSAELALDASLSNDPETRGPELVQNDCLSCHTKQMLEQQRLTPKQWGAVVKKMTGWGAPVEEGTSEILVSYLAAHYGTDAGAYDPPTLTAAQAAAALAPLDDGPFANGDAARGAALYRDRCAACHGQDGRGQLGVVLVDRPLLKRASDLADVIRRGKGRMAPNALMSDPEVADLLAHLRGLRP